jgi:biotin carboxyl carrier protein
MEGETTGAREAVSSMRYEIRIERKSREVEILRHDDSFKSGQQSYVATVHHQNRQKQTDVKILEKQSNRLVVSLEDKVYSITQLKRSPVSVTFVANGRMQTAQLKTKFEEEGLSLAPPIREYITATLPAKVVKISTKQGNSAAQGTELLVLEAMKMEVQILAPKDCKIKEIYVKEGESIEKGRKLIWLDFS